MVCEALYCGSEFVPSSPEAGYQVVAINELLGLGAANLAGALCGGVPTQIGLSRMGAPEQSLRKRPGVPFSGAPSLSSVCILARLFDFQGLATDRWVPKTLCRLRSVQALASLRLGWNGGIRAKSGMVRPSSAFQLGFSKPSSKVPRSIC